MQGIAAGEPAAPHCSLGGSVCKVIQGLDGSVSVLPSSCISAIATHKCRLPLGRKEKNFSYALDHNSTLARRRVEGPPLAPGGPPGGAALPGGGEAKMDPTGPDGGLGGSVPCVGDDLNAAAALDVFDLQEAAAAAAAAEDGPPPPPAGAAPNPSVRGAADRSQTSANPSGDSVRDSMVSALYSVTQSTASSQQLRESMAQMLQEIEVEEQARRKKVTLDEAWAKVHEADTGGAAPAPGEAPGSPNSVLRRRLKANSKRGRSLIRTFTAYAAKSRAPWARLGKDGRTWGGYFHAVVLDFLHVLRVYGVSMWVSTCRNRGSEPCPACRLTPKNRSSSGT